MSGFSYVIKLFVCFSYRNCASYGHTNHWVVARTDQTHHFYMGSAYAVEWKFANCKKWLDNGLICGFKI